MLFSEPLRELIYCLCSCWDVAITKYLPGIFNQLGLAGLMNNQNLFKASEEKKAEAQEEEEDVPELVESFEEVSKDE